MEGIFDDEQAATFAEFCRKSFTWIHIECRNLKKHLAPHFTKAARILDAGCGSGRISQFLVACGVAPENIVGIDGSIANIYLAKKNEPDVNFLVGDMREIPLPAGSIDVVVAHMLLESLDKQGLRDMLQESYRILRENGTLICLTTHPNAIRAELGVKHEGSLTRTSAWGTTVINYYRTQHQLKKQILAAGFSNVSFKALKMPRKARKDDKQQYKRYRKNGAVRLLVKAQKPPTL